jgi:putative transcriptional regulator
MRSSVFNARAARSRWRWVRLCAFLACFIPSLCESATELNDRDLAGQFLVASEEMKDPRFIETVIYMIKHNSEGTLGLVINRPLAKGSVDDLLKGFGAAPKGSKREIVIHYGGPVSSRQGFVLHTDDVKVESSITVKDGIVMTSDIKMIEAIATGHGPKQSLFMLGYTGWAPGQLAAEIKNQAWFVIPADKTMIFGSDAEKKWLRAMERRQTPL